MAAPASCAWDFTSACYTSRCFLLRVRWRSEYNDTKTCNIWTSHTHNDWCFRPRFYTVRLYWAGDNLGEWDESCYESCPWCRIDHSTCWPVVQRATNVPQMPPHTCMYYIYVCVYINIYIYTHTEREREREWERDWLSFVYKINHSDFLLERSIRSFFMKLKINTRQPVSS